MFLRQHLALLLISAAFSLILVSSSCSYLEFVSSVSSDELTGAGFHRGSHDLPDFDWVDLEGARIVLRRAAQMATIRWEPLLNIPNNTGFFEANSMVMGIPYSSTKQINKYVGFDVSFHTFMTAVHNQYSVLYTENLGQPPYNGVNCACYYGTVCSAAVAYALGLEHPITTNDIASDSRFKRIDFHGLEDLMPCDLMIRKGHVFMIYKIEKDSEGVVSNVTIFESASLLTSLKEYTAADFLARVKNEQMYLLRYNYLADVIDYHSTPYAPVGFEPMLPVQYNESLCPSRGDESVYRVDEDVVIDVMDMSYDTIVFEREGSVHYKVKINGIINNVGTLSPGQYKVYLTKNKKSSDFVQIIVLNPKVSVEIGDKVHITFHCDYAKPEYCSIVTKVGGQKATHLFSDDEIHRESVDLDRINGGPYYYKVIFSTPFGTIINEPICAD